MNLKTAYEIEESRYGDVICYPQEFLFEKKNQTGWENSSVLASSLPFFFAQLFVANLSYRVFYYLTRPLYLPPFAAQILCGFVFSPSLLGRNDFIVQHVFPFRFTMVLEAFANWALVYNIFLMGLEMDLRMVKRIELKSLLIAVFGVIVSLPIAIGLYYLPGNGANYKIPAGCFFWSIALSCTNFPELARILADLKLLRTDVGKTAMSAAVWSDLITWGLLVVSFSALTKDGHFNSMMPFVLISTVMFILLCKYVIRPGFVWALEKTSMGGHVGDVHVWFVAGGVLLFGLITDACGVHSITGAFLFGLTIPNDHIIKNMIEERLHDFLNGILMPLFFIICGLRADLVFMVRYIDLGVLAIVFGAAVLVKVLTTLVVSSLFYTRSGDAIALGLLMNTKGVLALVILNAGRDAKALDSPMYTSMVVVFLVMSLIMEPLLAFTYKPKKRLVNYTHRTIQKIKGENEFRVLACLHTLSNASGINNLLQISNPTKQSPINIFALHLVELTGRTTTASMLILNDECKSKVNFSDRVRAESDQIAETFEMMEVNNEAVMVQTITAMSPYVTMHEDICTLAEDNQVCFIILPYHKHFTADGRMGEGNASHADVNGNVLQHAPCSVGILVDRGIGLMQSEPFHGQNMKHVMMLFIGGPDDREALSYTWRMVGHYSVKLTVVRFILGRDALLSAGESAAWYKREKQVDDECIYEFNFKTRNDPSVTYVEKVVNDGRDTIAVIRDFDDESSYNLYVVGRGYKVDSPVTAGLKDWSSSPELGSLGDTLASSSFTMHASVLVIQQFSTTSRQAAATAATATAAVVGSVDHEELTEDQSNSHDAEPFMRSMYEDYSDDDDDSQSSVHK